MMDQFSKKREMIALLQKMLKHSAAEEVTGKKGLPQTKNAEAHPSAAHGQSPDLQKMSKGTMPHPHMTDLSQTNELQQRTSDSSKMFEGGMLPESQNAPYKMPISPKMAEGGIAGSDMSPMDEPNRLLEPKGQADSNQDETAVSALPGPIEDEGAEQDMLQAAHNEDMMDEDEDNNSSSFQGFFPRKRK